MFLRPNKLLAGLCVTLMGLNLSAFDLGITATSASVVLLPKISSPIFTESLKTTAYLNVPMGFADFRIEGVADLGGTYASSALKWTDPRFDLGGARLGFLIPLATGTDGNSAGALDFAFGRLNFLDQSGGWVLGGKADGGKVSYYSGKFHLDLQGWYTGLVLSKNSRVSLGTLDPKSTDSFAPRRAIAGINLGWNETFLRQDLQWDNIAQYDLRTSGETTHSAYSTVSIAGPFLFGFRQTTTATVSALITDWVPSYGVLASTEWSSNLAVGRLVLNGTWSQGLGESDSFVPVSGKGVGLVASYTAANAAAVVIDYSFSPIRRMSTGLKVDALLRPLSGRQPSLAGVLSTSTDFLLGEEAAIYGSWSTTSELALGWNLAAFFPTPSSFTSDTSPTYLAVLTATLEL